MSLLIDSSSWIEIGIDSTHYNISNRLRGGKALTVNDLSNNLFSNHELFTCEMIRKEINKFFVRKNSPVVISSRTEYELKTLVSELTDTNVPNNLKYLLTRDSPKSQDLEIYLSGKGEEIDIIVTQNESDFSIIQRKYCKYYNPELKKCTRINSIYFNNLKRFKKKRNVIRVISRKNS